MAHDVPVVAEDQVSVPVSLEKTPTKAVNFGFGLLATLANLVVWLAIVPLQSVVLPAQFSLLDPRNSAASFAFAATLSGVVALITQPLAGALSDMTFSRFGRRRPWLVVGSVATIIVLLLMANASSIVWLTITFTLFGITINCVLSPLVAVVPDRVPVKQRALVSACVSLAQALATVIGIAAFALVFRDIPATYSFFAVSLFLGIGLFAVFVKDPPVSKERLPRFSLVTFLREFFHPARYADYRFVWGTRFFVVMAQLIVVSFVYFYLQSIIHYDTLFPGQTVNQRVLLFQILSTACILISSLFAGFLSDRLQRRKVFVVVSCAIMTLALVLLALVPTWTGVLVVAALFGIGFGIFISADLALATQVIPEASERGKGIGLYLAAGSFPFLFLSLFATIALGWFHSYALLFGIAAAATALAGACILPVKSVR